MVDCPNCNEELDEESLREGVCSNCNTEIDEEILAATAGAFYGVQDYNLFGG